MLEIKITEINSTELENVSHNLIIMGINSETLSLAEECIEFMNKNDINYIVKDCNFKFSSYRLVREMPLNSTKDDELLFLENQIYEPLNSEDTLGSQTLKIFKEGDISVVINFKQSDDQLTFSIGHIGELKELANARNVKDLFVKNGFDVIDINMCSLSKEDFVGLPSFNTQSGTRVNRKKM